jgi:hypothetical protein
LPFGLCNAFTTFQWVVLGIFSNLIHACVEVYMDDFTVWLTLLRKSWITLEKFLVQCQETNISLNHEKCQMLLTQGIVLHHHIPSLCIKVDPTKIEVISNLPIPKTQKDVCSFLGHASYYRHFIANFTKIVSPLLKVFLKM